MNSRQPGSENFRPVQEHIPLPDRVAEQLRSMIFDGKLRPGTRLSNEPELSKALSVSRSTLRAALDRLTRDGLIVRRRGIGTFVASRPPLVTNLNINLGVTQFIRSSGAVPGVAELDLREDVADDRVATRLELELDTPVMAIERVRTANERRVIFSREFIPLGLFQTTGHQFSPDELKQFLATEQSLYLFLERRLGMEVHHGTAWLQPATADRALAEKLQIPVNSILMYIEQVDYDAHGRPLLLSDEYWVADAFAFSVHRVV